MKRVLSVIIGMMFTINLNGQQTYNNLNFDSLIISTRVSPRVAVSFQKGIGGEVGFMLDKYLVGIYKGNGFNKMVYSLSGFYLGSEFDFPKFKSVVLAPKLGYESGSIGYSNAVFSGAELIYYTDIQNNTNNSFAGLLKIGLPIGFMNIAYGFTMFFDGNMKSQIGKHRLTIDYILDWKAKRADRKMYERYKRLYTNKQ